MFSLLLLWCDSNTQPSEPKSDALTKLRYTTITNSFTNTYMNYVLGAEFESSDLHSESVTC